MPQAAPNAPTALNRNTLVSGPGSGQNIPAAGGPDLGALALGQFGLANNSLTGPGVGLGTNPFGINADTSKVNAASTSRMEALARIFGQSGGAQVASQGIASGGKLLGTGLF